MEFLEQYKTLDLFAGIGGIKLGFEQAGFKTVFSNDVDPYCKETYDLNSKNTKLFVDDVSKLIEDVELPDFEVLLAGFPCQSFSIAGYRRGFLDTGRGDLFFEIVRILREKSPEAFLLENVKNLKTHDKGRTFKIIKDSLEDLGYVIDERILNSMEYGNVPQNRERIYIVGFKSQEILDNFNFPKPIILTKKVSDILDDNVEEKYYYNNHVLFPQLNEEMNIGPVYQWRRAYVRENKSGVCPTLTANMGTGGHNVPLIKDHLGVRKLTPKECLRLQGFPESFKLPQNLPDSRLYKQIGNSVTVSVVNRVAKEMKKVLDQSYVSKSTAKRAS